MNKVKIIAHCLVKNDERFVWYSLQSVLPYVDKIMIWDTGSTDKTVKIVKTIKSSKISFKEVGNVDANSFTLMRQKMIEQTPKSYTWFMVLDGDEIWPSESIKQATDYARNNPQMETIAVRTNNHVGDIYHKLPESAGQYQLAGKKGHLALRFMNQKKIPGLHASLPHGQIGYFDNKKTLIQNRNPRKMKLLDVAYSHTTHLPRSSADQRTIKRSFKRKYEIGEKVASSQLPEVFFAKHPKNVPGVTHKASFPFWILALLQTIPRRLKRLILAPKSGY